MWGRGVGSRAGKEGGTQRCCGSGVDSKACRRGGQRACCQKRSEQGYAAGLGSAGREEGCLLR